MESPNSAREDIIKIQHKMKSTREKWRGTKYDFYLLAHEHLYIQEACRRGETVGVQVQREVAVMDARWTMP